MNKYQDAETWTPTDGIQLEVNALTVAKSDGNYLVSAGPGAGKTELLAQRACYLLQTNTCKYPKRILAISFKKDAAKNLKDRVIKRCGADLGYRFESMTYDAFAKTLLDRFKHGIKDCYRPKSNYEITFNINDIFKTDCYKSCISDIVKGKGMQAQLLPLNKEDRDFNTKAYIWHNMLKRDEHSYLTFQMISSLAIYLIQTNKIIKDYIQQTYSHVFLDEFQDTTLLQYELVKACFLGADTQITAVGDGKQRIMLWAGAVKNIFNQYSQDFVADDISLLMNFRSAPKLVELQRILTSSLMGQEIAVTPSTHWQQDSGTAEMYIFKNEQQEATIIAKLLKHYIEVENRSANSICVVVKQQLDIYTIPLIKATCDLGINVRSEDKYQDILVDDYIRFIIHILYYSADKSLNNHFLLALDYVIEIKSIHNDYDKITTQKKINDIIIVIREKYNETTNIRDFIQFSIEQISTIISIDELNVLYPTYSDKSYLNSIICRFKDLVVESYAEFDTLLHVIDKVEGKDAIPMMTIHKSKGLEYDIVLFIGFEDSAFWNYKNQKEEDTCAFFVAISRAKEKLIFSCSAERNDKYGVCKSQHVVNIKPLYDALNSSGILEFHNYV